MIQKLSVATPRTLLAEKVIRATNKGEYIPTPRDIGLSSSHPDFPLLNKMLHLAYRPAGRVGNSEKEVFALIILCELFPKEAEALVSLLESRR